MQVISSMGKFPGCAQKVISPRKIWVSFNALLPGLNFFFCPFPPIISLGVLVLISFGIVIGVAQSQAACSSWC